MIGCRLNDQSNQECFLLCRRLGRFTKSSMRHPGLLRSPQPFTQSNAGVLQKLWICSWRKPKNHFVQTNWCSAIPLRILSMRSYNRKYESYKQGQEERKLSAQGRALADWGLLLTKLSSNFSLFAGKLKPDAGKGRYSVVT
eukprot:Gregarina_sp_Poly_1__1498@NODE_1376_length_4266_cov_52_069540_g920_i0_p5_GENE_NODE_1376_length_4266_cov_52_069540_g920_i0NODE_1376_length_4266_cov_52_069540_g920_i0_p5_ORF_typecomplete_len141_score8_60_NODE_1376_length_4266_cov_52_069540_g920_i010831505